MTWGVAVTRRVGLGEARAGGRQPDGKTQHKAAHPPPPLLHFCPKNLLIRDRFVDTKRNSESRAKVRADDFTDNAECWSLEGGVSRLLLDGCKRADNSPFLTGRAVWINATGVDDGKSVLDQRAAMIGKVSAPM